MTELTNFIFSTTYLRRNVFEMLEAEYLFNLRSLNIESKKIIDTNEVLLEDGVKQLANRLIENTKKKDLAIEFSDNIMNEILKAHRETRLYSPILYNKSDKALEQIGILNKRGLKLYKFTKNCERHLQTIIRRETYNVTKYICYTIPY